MDVSVIGISEMIALIGLIGVGFKGWLVVQKELTRLDADVTNLKEDLHSDREINKEWFRKIESKLDRILEKFMK